MDPCRVYGCVTCFAFSFGTFDNTSGGKNEHGKYNTTKAGFINNIDMFDPLEFGISAKEAPHFDAAIRLTLEASFQVFTYFLIFKSLCLLVG